MIFQRHWAKEPPVVQKMCLPKIVTQTSTVSYRTRLMETLSNIYSKPPTRPRQPSSQLGTPIGVLRCSIPPHKDCFSHSPPLCKGEGVVPATSVCTLAASMPTFLAVVFTLLVRRDHHLLHLFGDPPVDANRSEYACITPLPCALETLAWKSR